MKKLWLRDLRKAKNKVLPDPNGKIQYIDGLPKTDRQSIFFLLFFCGSWYLYITLRENREVTREITDSVSGKNEKNAGRGI